MQTICSEHENKVIAVCFAKDCAQSFLCKRCIKAHPDEHDSNIEDISSLEENEKWTEAYEQQKGSQTAQIEAILQQSKSLIAENQEILKEGINLMKASFEEKLSTWMEELQQEMNQDPETLEVFSKLEEDLKTYKSINFRNENVFERISQVKTFNNSHLPKTSQLIDRAQSIIASSKLDEQKMEKYKEEITQFLNSISLKDLMMMTPFKSLMTTEKLVSLEKEYEQLKQDKSIEIKELTQETQEFQAKIVELISQNEVLISENIKIKDESDKMKKMIEEYELLKHDKSKEIQELQAKIVELQYQNEVLKSENNRVKNKNDEMNKVIEDLSIQMLSWSEESKIVYAGYFKKLEEWIPKVLIDNKPQKVKLELLYRATRDGFTSVEFHKKCGSYSPTISFIQAKESGNIFGGYTSVNWTGMQGYKMDPEAFLFSLTHGEKYPCKNPERAIWICSGYTLAFGAFGDISILDGSDSSAKAYTNFPRYYDCSKFPDYGGKSYLTGKEQFTVKEIEVYQVCFI